MIRRKRRKRNRRKKEEDSKRERIADWPEIAKGYYNLLSFDVSLGGESRTVKFGWDISRPRSRAQTRKTPFRL